MDALFLFLLIFLLDFLCSAAITLLAARRCHDLGLSGLAAMGWYLAPFPCSNAFLLALMLAPGRKAGDFGNCNTM